MPMRTPEEQKEYQKAWYQRKKAGLETRTNPKLSEEELKRRKKLGRPKWNNYRRERYKRRKKLLVEKFGEKCHFCGADESERRLAFHKKNGNEHQKFGNMSKETFEKIIKGDGYIRLCYGCHKHIHWCMEVLRMTWDEINSHLQ